MEQQNDSTEPSVSQISEIVAVKQEAVWQSASIPTVSHTRITQMIRKFRDEYRCLLKPYKCRKNDSKYCAKITSFFRKHNNTLFDIAACKCNWSECKCSKDRKVPTEEREFLSDQTILRYTVIAGVDNVACSRRKRFMVECSCLGDLQYGIQQSISTARSFNNFEVLPHCVGYCCTCPV